MNSGVSVTAGVFVGSIWSDVCVGSGVKVADGVAAVDSRVDVGDWVSCAWESD